MANANPISCLLCDEYAGYTSLRPKDITQHIYNRHHGHFDPRYSCQCGNLFKRNADLVDHKKFKCVLRAQEAAPSDDSASSSSSDAGSASDPDAVEVAAAG